MDARFFELPCSSRNMPSKEEALAKRLAILAFWVAHPGTGAYQSEVLQPNLDFIRSGVFQQDGASSHTSVSTRAFLASKGVNVLADWPALSPDLNPVEHCWAYLARELVGESFSSEDELEAAIRAAWARKPLNFIPKLFGSMVRRLTAVVVARGGATRY